MRQHGNQLCRDLRLREVLLESDLLSFNASGQILTNARGLVGHTLFRNSGPKVTV